MRYALSRFCTFVKILKWKGWLWLPSYVLQQTFLRWRADVSSEPSDILFVFVDHFEPSRKQGALGVKAVRDWCKAYEEIAVRYTDSDGLYPQHSWFYRYDYPNLECIQILNKSVFEGLGEIEFHLHHGNDNQESFFEKLVQGVEWFNQVGAMIFPGESLDKRFAYIAGNWALDNGRRDPSMSGVNEELVMLKKAGCYADFTFPAFGTNSQPRKVNSIYYAQDTPAPKSYTSGKDLKVGGNETGDLLIFQGPLYVDWRKRYIEYAAIETFVPFTPARIDYWLSSFIHVRGRPEWLFIKLHTHGMQSREQLLKNDLNNLFLCLEQRFEAGRSRLHYITAREAYNIVLAAQAGEKGNPNDYRDYVIPRPVNRSIFCNRPYLVKCYTDGHLHLCVREPRKGVILRFRDVPVILIEGEEIVSVELFHADGKINHITIIGHGKCRIQYAVQEGEQGGAEQVFEVALPFYWCKAPSSK